MPFPENGLVWFADAGLGEAALYKRKRCGNLIGHKYREQPEDQNDQCIDIDECVKQETHVLVEFFPIAIMGQTEESHRFIFVVSDGGISGNKVQSADLLVL